MARARVKLPPELEGRPLFQIEVCIKEANLGKEDSRLLRAYIIDQIPQVELAEELGWNRSTVSRHCKAAMSRIAEVAAKLHITCT